MNIIIHIEREHKRKRRNPEKRGRKQKNKKKTSNKWHHLENATISMNHCAGNSLPLPPAISVLVLEVLGTSNTL